MQLAMQVLQALTAQRAAETGARRFVSGAQLAGQFGVTRSAVWKSVGRLRRLGTGIEAVTHRGYRLALPASPLEDAAIRADLRPETRSALRSGECAGIVESTSSVLLARAAPPPGQFDYIAAEYQSAGRGRRGRSWLAPPGGAVCLSWSWCFASMPAQLGALSLAIGVAGLRALAAQGVTGVQLKWPNDLVTSHGKLGGILIEMRSEAAGPVHLVIGIGLNMALGRTFGERIEAGNLAAVDVYSLLPAGRTMARSPLAAGLLNEGIAAIQRFARDGFEPFRGEYAAADALRDRQVRLQGGVGIDSGVARGVDADGALLVARGGQVHRVLSGEVSVRAQHS